MKKLFIVRYSIAEELFFYLFQLKMLIEYGFANIERLGQNFLGQLDNLNTVQRVLNTCSRTYTQYNFPF